MLSKRVGNWTDFTTSCPSNPIVSVVSSNMGQAAYCFCHTVLECSKLLFAHVLLDFQISSIYTGAIDRSLGEQGLDQVRERSGATGEDLLRAACSGFRQLCDGLCVPRFHRSPLLEACVEVVDVSLGTIRKITTYSAMQQDWPLPFRSNASWNSVSQHHGAL